MRTICQFSIRQILIYLKKCAQQQKIKKMIKMNNALK